MKLLIVSDSHHDQDTLQRVSNRYTDIPIKIHCGDSDVPYDDPSISSFINVKGNHDYDDRFPIYQIIQLGLFKALVVHGHLHGIWKGYDQILLLANENGCNLVFHGHTHIPCVNTFDDIFVLNPGSLMFNRGSYGYGTYVLFDIKEDGSFEYHYYHHETDEEVTQFVLEDGLNTFEELRPFIERLP